MEPTFHTCKGATTEALAALRSAYPSLPDEYFDFLARSNGAEGDLGVDPGWFIVWDAEEALIATGEYEIPTYLPGFFSFGGNGGGELFVIALAPDGSRPVFMVPAIGMEPSALVSIAASFPDFVAAMGKVTPEC